MTDQQTETPSTDVATTEPRQLTPEQVAWYEQREQDKRADLARLEQRPLDSWAVMLSHAAQLGRAIAGTEFVPEGLRTEAGVTAAVLYGRELGLGPMTALQNMHVVNGKVGLSAEHMRAMVLAAGHEFEVVESTSARCKVRGRRRGSTGEWANVAYTMDDVRQAGLLEGRGGTTWAKYPRQKLIARASAELCRNIFPDVTHGLAATEELRDDAEGDETPTSAPSTPARTAVKRTTRKRTPAAEPAAGGPPPPASDADGGGARPDTPPPPPVDDESRDEPPAAPSSSSPSGAGGDATGGEAGASDGPPAPDTDPPAEQPETVATPQPITAPQQRMLRGQLGKLEVVGSDAQRAVILRLAERTDLDSTTGLTKAEAHNVIEVLNHLDDPEQLTALMGQLAQEDRAKRDGDDQ